MRKVFYLVTEDWYFHMHWLNMAAAIADDSFNVTVVTRVSVYGDAIRARGLTVVPLHLPRSAKYPWRDVQALSELIRIYRRERPDIVHHLALKAVVVGTLAALFARTPLIVNSLPGLGYVFASRQRAAKVLRYLVGFVLRCLNERMATWTVFQNPDDYKMLCDAGVVKPDAASVIRGTGVDLNKFRPRQHIGSAAPVVLLASRLLWDKGVGEFVAAARQLRSEIPQVRFILVGDTDADNPHSVSQQQLQVWQSEGVIEWWGRRGDMPNVFQQSDIICLPSYREGLPTVLLEAAASGLPIVTTDAPGCREVVKDGVNGLLVSVRDVDGLVIALRTLLSDSALRNKMGDAGRSMAEQHFSVERVVAETLKLYSMLATKGTIQCRKQFW